MCWERYRQCRIWKENDCGAGMDPLGSGGGKVLVTAAEYTADFHRAAKVALPFTVEPETQHDRHVNRMRRLFELHVIQDWPWPQAVSLMPICDCLPGVECKCWNRRHVARPQSDWQAAKWWDEVQIRVGRELEQSEVWPLRRYFTEPSDGGKLPLHPRVSL